MSFVKSNNLAHGHIGCEKPLITKK